MYSFRVPGQSTGVHRAAVSRCRHRSGAPAAGVGAGRLRARGQVAPGRCASGGPLHCFARAGAPVAPGNPGLSIAMVWMAFPGEHSIGRAARELASTRGWFTDGGAPSRSPTGWSRDSSLSRTGCGPGRPVHSCGPCCQDRRGPFPGQLQPRAGTRCRGRGPPSCGGSRPRSRGRATQLLHEVRAVERPDACRGRLPDVPLLPPEALQEVPEDPGTPDLRDPLHGRLPLAPVGAVEVAEDPRHVTCVVPGPGHDLSMGQEIIYNIGWKSPSLIHVLHRMAHPGTGPGPSGLAPAWESSVNLFVIIRIILVRARERRSPRVPQVQSFQAGSWHPDRGCTRLAHSGRVTVQVKDARPPPRQNTRCGGGVLGKNSISSDLEKYMIAAGKGFWDGQRGVDRLNPRKGNTGRSDEEKNEAGDIIRVRLPQKRNREMFAQAELMMGANHIRVKCYDGVTRLGRIKGKIKKRIWIREGDILIVVPWSFQDDKCDIIYRYTGPQVEWLRRNGYL